MKKHRIILIALLLALCTTLSFALIACQKTPKDDYSVTVLSPDDAPLSGITVSWRTSSSVAGSAVTGEDGKATASLPLGTYSVELSGHEEGLAYTSVSVTAQMRNIQLSLEIAKIEYSATVVDKDGKPAQNVVISWTNGTTIAGTAKTNTNGQAVCTLAYGNYSVTAANLPNGNVAQGALSATGKAPNVRFELIAGVTASYSVTFRSEGGLIFKNHLMQVYSGDTLVAFGNTDENGVYAFQAAAGSYTAHPDTKALPKGYTVTPAELTETVLSAEVIAYSAPINASASDSVRYVMGDIIHNYSFTTPYEVDGAPLSFTIAEILKTKKAVLINNWGKNCSWCVQEMPAMQEAYEKYKDSIELIAVDNYQGGDSDSTIAAYYAQYGYTFPMVRDTYGLAAKFSLTAWPATIVIDRYGAIARIESGAVLDPEIWGRMIEKYIGDDYVQTFTPGSNVSDSITTEVSKPDVVLDNNHYEKIAQTLHNTSLFPEGASVVWFGETEYEYAWPFVLGTDPDVSPDEKVLYSSNTGKANSMSIIYATVNVTPGKVFSFEYYASTQTSDVLSIVWDGKIVKQISGNSRGWQTCNLYADITSGNHSFAMTYMKDSSGNVGKDNVYFRNVHFTDVSALTEPTDMLRAAAYGTPDADATRFPYYASVTLMEDGYYHVNLSELENANLAGNDEKPLLFVNLLNATNWSSLSIGTLVSATDATSGEYRVDCTFTIGGVTKDYREELVEYLRIANASDVEDCLPVDRELHDLLVAFMARVSEDKTHADEWLEACYFYSHYGSGDPVGNPILGLTTKTAFTAQEGTNTADITRNMYPFSTTIFTFTPETSAVYKIESLIPEKDAATYMAQIWLFDDDTSAEKPLVYSGDNRFVRTGENEHNFEVYRYLTAGHKYYLQLAFLMSETGVYDFKITNVGQSYTLLEGCSENAYGFVTNDKGEYTGELYLLGAVDYVKDEDGYFHAVNPDGSIGSYIYFDVKYATALTTMSISTLVDQYLKVPTVNVTLDYKTFDFRYMIAYFSDTTEEGTTTSYFGKYNLTSRDPDKYKDYTEIMKEYIAKAETTGDKAGLVKVDQQLVDILTLFMETRINMLLDGVYEDALENEWLRFCWYDRTYDSENI